MKFIRYQDVDHKLDWSSMVQALKSGHELPKAKISDHFIRRDDDTLLSRAAWIDGLGIAVKSVTVFPENAQKDRPTVQGAMLLFDEKTGSAHAIIDSALVTKWKTIADSLLGAKILARPDSKHLLVIGAGHVAQHAISGYLHMFPNLEKISVHARSKNSVEALIQSFSLEQPMVCAVDDLRKTVGQADIIVTATTSQQPVVKGAWLKPGVHLDLIGAFKIDMREVDDEALLRARVFVDARETVLEHIGELAIPIAQGIITPDYLLGDLYDLVHGYCGRTNEKEITLYKNGGGAHLDLMIAHEIQKFL